jgi:hypothetical protein
MLKDVSRELGIGGYIVSVAETLQIREIVVI